MEHVECLLLFGPESFVFGVLCRIIKNKIYRIVVLSFVLYGRATWPVTLREERRLSVFENAVLRKVFGHKSDEETGGWIGGDYVTRSLKICTSHHCYSGDESRRMRWTGRVKRMGEMRGAYRVLVGKPEGKRPLGRRRRRCEYNIKMCL